MGTRGYVSGECEYFVLMAVGQRIVVVRCEEINISGSFYRNKREKHNSVYTACVVLEQS